MAYMCICISAQTRFMIFVLLNVHSDISGSMDGVPTIIEEASTIPTYFYKNKFPIDLYVMCTYHYDC